MPYRNYGQVDGGSGLGDFLAGLVGGYQSSASEREQLRLAREREQRYAEQQAMEAEDRRLARERQGILDAAQGIYRADQVDPAETVRVGGIEGPDRTALDATSRALAGLPGFEDAGRALTTAAQTPDATENRYQRVGDYAIDRTRFDPELQKRMAADATRVAEGRARRGLMQLTGEDGKPLFQANEVLGQTGDALKGLQSLGATLPIQQRMAAQDRAVRNQDARDMATFQSGLRKDEAAYGARLQAQYREGPKPQLVETDKGWMEWTPGGGMTPVKGPDGKPVVGLSQGRPLPVNEARTLLDANSLIGGIDGAMGLISNPEGTGPKDDATEGAFRSGFKVLPGALSSWVANKIDPDGRDARATVSVAVADLRHKLAGANFTANEKSVLEPFIPDVTGDDFPTIVSKLRAMRRNLKTIMEARSKGLTALGYAVPTDFGGAVDGGGTATPSLEDILTSQY